MYRAEVSGVQLGAGLSFEGCGKPRYRVVHGFCCDRMGKTLTFGDECPEFNPIEMLLEDDRVLVRSMGLARGQVVS
jgi:hypothetical protein